jgi:hypothetical protein
MDLFLGNGRHFLWHDPDPLGANKSKHRAKCTKLAVGLQSFRQGFVAQSGLVIGGLGRELMRPTPKSHSDAGCDLRHVAGSGLPILIYEIACIEEASLYGSLRLS